MYKQWQIYKKRITLCLSLIILSSCLLFSKSIWAQSSSATTSKEVNKIFSEAVFATNYVLKGITQTETDPAFQGGMGYQYGMFKGGVWGSNVRFEGSDEHLQLKIYMNFNVEFNADYQLLFGYDLNNFYKNGGGRNYSEFNLGFHIYGYKIHYLQNTNFEASESASTHLQVSKELDIPWGLKLDTGGGYNMPSDTDTFKSYVDIFGKVIYRYQNFDFFSTLTMNSNSSQFGDRGKMFFYLGAKASL